MEEELDPNVDEGPGAVETGGFWLFDELSGLFSGDESGEETLPHGMGL